MSPTGIFYPKGIICGYSCIYDYVYSGRTREGDDEKVNFAFYDTLSVRVKCLRAFMSYYAMCGFKIEDPDLQGEFEFEQKSNCKCVILPENIVGKRESDQTK